MRLVSITLRILQGVRNSVIGHERQDALTRAMRISIRTLSKLSDVGCTDAIQRVMSDDEQDQPLSRYDEGWLK